MRVNLVLLAKSTAFNIAADKGSEAGPPEFSGDQLASFQVAGMTGGFVIMATLEDGTVEGVVCRDVDTTPVSKDAGFNLPVSEPGTKGKRNVLVHRLEGLEDEGSPAEADLMRWERAVSMRLTKREGGRRVTSVLSESSAGRRSGRRERASGPARSFPGTWTIFRSKSARSMSQCTWRRLSACGWQK